MCPARWRKRFGTTVFRCFIASATLAFGLAIFVLSRFPGLRQFGATASFSIIANFLITLLMILCFGRFLPRVAAKQRSEKQLFLFTLSAKITALHEQYRLLTLAGMILLLAFACIGIFHVRIDTPFFPLFRKGFAADAAAFGGKRGNWPALRPYAFPLTPGRQNASKNRTF